MMPVPAGRLAATLEIITCNILVVVVQYLLRSVVLNTSRYASRSPQINHGAAEVHHIPPMHGDFNRILPRRSL